MTPIVGITAGDPAGIGYELVLRTVTRAELHEQLRPVVYGSRRALERDAKWLGVTARFVDAADGIPERTSSDTILLSDVDQPDDDSVPLGELSPTAGDIAVRSVRAAVADALAERIHALCTAPLNKESMWQAGHRYDGHTGLLAELCAGADVSMLLVGDRLRVAHVTTHVAFEEVPERLTPERIRTVVRIAGETLQALGFAQPRIAVAGLNPHAGEQGIFGDQEVTTIGPAIDLARQDGWEVTGPVSPDAVFNAALAGHYDVVVAMYHDQGHIPVKLIEFDRAVNISGGLPIVRTSVDHGTAFDIAGQGIARTENLEVALAFAARMGANRRARRTTEEG